MDRHGGNPFSSLLDSWAQGLGGNAAVSPDAGERAAQIAALQQEALARHAQLW